MTMGYVAVAISVIGAAVSAASQYQAGQSQKEAANYNARMQERAANDALNRGAIEASQVKDKTRRLISAQIAASGAAGFDSSTGTNLDLSTEAAGFGELDALKTINNSQRQAAGMSAQANLDRFQGAAASRAGTMNAAGTLLSGAGSAYYGFKKGQLSEANSQPVYKANGEFI